MLSRLLSVGRAAVAILGGRFRHPGESMATIQGSNVTAMWIKVVDVVERLE
jgi:hypothetical protein